MVQSDRSGRQAVARTPSPPRTEAGRACILLMAGEGFGPLSLPNQRLHSVSLRWEPVLCPDTWNSYHRALSVLLDPVCLSGDSPHPNKDVLGVRTLKMMVESLLKRGVGKALSVWFSGGCSKIGGSLRTVSRSPSSGLAFWDFPRPLKFWCLLSNP